MRYYLRKYKRSPYWYFKLSAEGQVVQDWKTTGKKRKRDAEQYVIARVRAFETENHPVTVDEAFSMLAAHKERKSASDATMEKLSLKASHIRSHFGPERNVLTISLSETTAYLDKRRRQGAKDSTIAMELGELRAALRQLKRFGRYPGEPAAIWPEELRRSFPSRKRWLPFEQYQALREALSGSAGRDWSDHLTMYTYTSMRWSELYRPEARDLDGDQLRIRGTKTATSDRWISLHPDALRVVKERVKRFPEGALFPMRAPNMKAEMRAWHSALKRACERVGIEHVSTNDLRRTFCSWCFQRGVPMELVVKWMGHASSKMVMRVYAQTSAAQGRREIAKLPKARRYPTVTPKRKKGDET